MKIMIYENHVSGCIDFYIYKDINRKKFISKPVELEFVEVDEDGSSNDPTFQLNRYDAPEFMQSLAEELSKKHIKTDNDHKIQGTLDATKKHLNDMRKLVFLNIKETK